MASASDGVKVTPIRLYSIVRTGPLGAVIVATGAGVRFMEARVSVTGTVIQFGIPSFKEA